MSPSESLNSGEGGKSNEEGLGAGMVEGEVSGTCGEAVGESGTEVLWGIWSKVFWPDFVFLAAIKWALASAFAFPDLGADHFLPFLVFGPPWSLFTEDKYWGNLAIL